MAEVEQGWRERKKARTRRALIEEGLRLFLEQGYQETRVDQVAAAAGIAPRTFFGYFAGKEDIVFADTPARRELALRVIRERAPGDTVDTVLRRVVRETFATDPGDLDLLGLTPERMRLVAATPDLQSAALRLLRATEAALAAELAAAFPEELDEVAAAMVVGSLVGAVMGATAAALGRGDPPEAVRTAATRAVTHALRP
ncbi:TetR/AcrR family transcriptional regulator [Nocardiopsis trehalosi]|uniref:TetR/AcrR family transcriptional regulator n=1 Tax=Nocardiopsis trehalosi TaxID=109329 RepID=UPI00082B09A4|nr:TetR/AcrR family transcriptional regulator [Nocardiopsis trehalosi]